MNLKTLLGPCYTWILTNNVLLNICTICSIDKHCTESFRKYTPQSSTQKCLKMLWFIRMSHSLWWVIGVTHKWRSAAGTETAHSRCNCNWATVGAQSTTMKYKWFCATIPTAFYGLYINFNFSWSGSALDFLKFLVPNGFGSWIPVHSTAWFITTSSLVFFILLSVIITWTKRSRNMIVQSQTKTTDKNGPDPQRTVHRSHIWADSSFSIMFL